MLGFQRISWSIVSILTAGLLAGTAVSQQSSLDAHRLVSETAYNELHPPATTQHFLYKDTTVSKKGSVTKEVIQTPQGPLSRTVAINGSPLTPEQRAKEDAKLQKFANDSAARLKKQQAEKEESQREDLMVKTLPDAFVYTYVGKVPGPHGSELVHLTFKPNPSFTPPNHETQVYLGMEGDMYIDAGAKRLSKIDGTLFKDVNFGWGILGKLDKGGKFVIEQDDVGSGEWQSVGQTLKFTGKVLMVKPLEIDSRETMTDFRPVPSQLTTAQALDLLQKADEVVARNGGVTASGKH